MEKSFSQATGGHVCLEVNTVKRVDAGIGARSFTLRFSLLDDLVFGLANLISFQCLYTEKRPEIMSKCAVNQGNRHYGGNGKSRVPAAFGKGLHNGV